MPTRNSVVMPPPRILDRAECDTVPGRRARVSARLAVVLLWRSHHNPGLLRSGWIDSRNFYLIIFVPRMYHYGCGDILRAETS